MQSTASTLQLANPRRYWRIGVSLRDAWKCPGWVAMQSTASTIQLANLRRYWRIGVSLCDVSLCDVSLCDVSLCDVLRDVSQIFEEP
jgi:ribosomal protein L39E